MIPRAIKIVITALSYLYLRLLKFISQTKNRIHLNVLVLGRCYLFNVVRTSL